MMSWEVLLSKGQEWDWLGDPWHRVHALAAIFALCLGGLVWHELRVANPIINFRPLAERNLAASCLIVFCAYGVLYGASTSLPGLLQTLMGYDAYISGLIMSPSGIFSIMVMIVVSTLLGRGADARWLIAAGLLTIAGANYWMAHLNTQISPWQVIWPRVVMIMGLSMVFAPLSVAAFMYTPRHLRAAAVGLFALLRNEGGSVGTSMGQTIEQRREQFHLARLGESLDPFNPAVHSFTQQARAFFEQATGDPAGSLSMTWQALADLRQEQAMALAYFDVFWVFAVLGALLVLLVPLMKRSVADKGAHIGAE